MNLNGNGGKSLLRLRRMAEVAMWVATLILVGVDIALIGTGLLFDDAGEKHEQIILHVGRPALAPIVVAVVGTILSKRMWRRHFRRAAVFCVAVPALVFWAMILFLVVHVA